MMNQVNFEQVFLTISETEIETKMYYDELMVNNLQQLHNNRNFAILENSTWNAWKYPPTIKYLSLSSALSL